MTSNAELEQQNSALENFIKGNCILKSVALADYILETSAYPNEHPQLKELRDASAQKYRVMSVMNVPVDEAQFISLILNLMGAKNTLEVGVFTGYSLLATALALPEDGKVTAIDPDREAYEVGLPSIKKAGVEHKINFLHGTALPHLNDLIAQGKEGTFDFAFVDADKDNYINYHELLLKLVKVGGLIAYDNTLWFGTVALSDDDLKKNDPILNYLKKHGYEALKKVNPFLANDKRVESTLLSIGDGLTLCRRKY